MNRHTVDARFRKAASARNFAAPLSPSPTSAKGRLHESGHVPDVDYPEGTPKPCGLS
jgi:hypothetical protein